MRTTIRLPDQVMEEARQYALETGTSLTGLFEEALREHLARARQAPVGGPPPELPTFRGSGPLPGVDLHDSAALLDVMEGKRRARP